MQKHGWVSFNFSLSIVHNRTKNKYKNRDLLISGFYLILNYYNWYLKNISENLDSNLINIKVRNKNVTVYSLVRTKQHFFMKFQIYSSIKKEIYLQWKNQRLSCYGKRYRKKKYEIKLNSVMKPPLKVAQKKKHLWSSPS